MYKMRSTGDFMMSKQGEKLEWALYLEVKSPWVQMRIGPVNWTQRGIREAIKQAKIILEVFEQQARWGDP